MAFWCFMLLIDLLIPFTMIGFGKMFQKHPPKDINWAFGYRTSMSMKTKDTWNFAHQYCGRLWQICGWILLPLSALPLLFVLGQDKDTIGTLGGNVCLMQIIFLILPILPTEIALRKNFDRNGFPKHLEGS